MVQLKSMKVTIRKMGNSQDVLIPKPILAQLGLIVLDQIRTLDRTRLVKRLGALRAPTLALTLQTLQAMFAVA